MSRGAEGGECEAAGQARLRLMGKGGGEARPQASQSVIAYLTPYPYET